MVNLFTLPSFSWNKWIRLFVLLGAAALWISPVYAATGINITAKGDQSYYLGEEVVFTGYNYDSDFTYFFIVGPNLPYGGGKLTSPRQNVISGDSNSFDFVKTPSEKTWKYVLYTNNLEMDPGIYTIYAVSQPKTRDQLELGGENYKYVSVIIKKPFLSADISPSTISKGQPFNIIGKVEGNPSTVQIWLIGDNYLFQTTTPVNPDTSYNFKIYNFNFDKQKSENLSNGQYYLVVQHSMMNNQFDVTIKDNVIIKRGTNNQNVFNFKSSAKWNALDAKNALLGAINIPNVDDTYIEIPFFVDDTGIKSGAIGETSVSELSTPQAQPTTTTLIQQQTSTTPTQTQPPITSIPLPQPSPQQTQSTPLQYAPIGAILLTLGIVVWCRR